MPQAAAKLVSTRNHRHRSDGHERHQASAAAYRQVGILTNPASSGNLRHGNRVTKLLADRLPTARHFNARTVTEMNHALTEFQRAGVELLVINGGDGTVQATLTYLFATAATNTWRPTLVLLRAGTASMLARDVGLAGSPRAALERLATAHANGQPGKIVTRTILHVVSAPSSPPQCGMFFGCGAVCQGIDLCHHKLNPSGIRGELMPGLIMLHLLLDLARGRHDRLGPINAGGFIDNHPLPRSSYLLAVVTSLERLVLGFRPFWGRQDLPLHITAIEARAPRLLVRVRRILGGRPDRAMTPEHGFHSASGERIQLNFRGAFTLDGEVFSTIDGITITPAGPARFLVL
jgi:hypothetical protein